VSNMFFDIPLRLPNTLYNYGDIVAANEVYSPPLAVALAEISSSLAAGFAFEDYLAGGILTPFMGCKIERFDSTGKKIAGYIKAAGTGAIYGLNYPLYQTADFVKATSEYDATYHPHYGTDPLLSLIGNASGNAWGAAASTNQRVNIDLGSSKIINRIYYENYHAVGMVSDAGARHFILQGSNDPAAFAETAYAIDTGWTTIQTGLEMAQHVALDQADPKYIDISNGTGYRYFSLKIANSWGNPAAFMGFRRLVLQTQIAPSETGVTIVSEREGTTQSWESIESGFNANDPAGYTVQIYRSGYVYMCSDPGISAATTPEFDRTPGSMTTDGGVIWTQCTPAGMRYQNPCTFDANPRYGDYRRGKKYFQPMDKADGGDLYVYDKGLAAENTRSISWEKILPDDLTRLLEFIEMVRGAAYPFNFYDETGVVHQVRITNPTEIKSAPVSFNFEGGIAVELLFINEPEAAETDEAYYADGTCWADGIIYAG
jgi:hypothetical protein